MLGFYSFNSTEDPKLTKKGSLLNKLSFKKHDLCYYPDGYPKLQVFTKIYIPDKVIK